jgi:ketosteroid isomerase-like protein
MSVKNKVAIRGLVGMRNATAMKRYFQFLLLVTLAIVSAVGNAQMNPGQDSDSARVLALETLWNQAEVAKDAAALDHLLADDFTFVDIDGSLQNKAEFLESIKHPAEHIEIIGNDTLKTHVYRDTVIVNGTYHEKGTLNGKAYIHRGRFTDTWVRQGSSWMCVASHSTLMQR